MKYVSNLSCRKLMTKSNIKQSKLFFSQILRFDKEFTCKSNVQKQNVKKVSICHEQSKSCLKNFIEVTYLVISFCYFFSRRSFQTESDFATKCKFGQENPYTIAMWYCKFFRVEGVTIRMLKIRVESKSFDVFAKMIWVFQNLWISVNCEVIPLIIKVWWICENSTTQKNI